MKKFLFSIIIIISCSSSVVFSQTNTFPVSGNVGIGITNPISPLHLIGNMTLQGLSTSNYIPTLLFKRYSDGAPMFSLGYKNPSAPNSYVDFNSLNGNPITFSMVNVERMSILENGNVGIGTLSPQTKLDVRGSIISANPDYSNGSTGSILQIQQGVTSGNTYSEIGAYINGGTAWGNLILNRGGNVGIGTTVPSQKLDVLGNANISGIITTSTINSIGAKSQMSGVDIGNPTGDNNIQIGSGNGAFGSRYAYLDIVGDDTYTDYGLRLIRGNTGLNANSQLVHRGTGDLQIYTNEAAPILFITETTEKMRVLANGNIGIGTLTPNSKLDVRNGKIIAGTTNATGGSVVLESNYDQAGNYGSLSVLGTNCSTGGWVLGYGITPKPGIFNSYLSATSGGVGRSAITVESELKFLTASPQSLAIGSDIAMVERMKITNEGNVGIGTTTPTAKLEIASSTGSGLKLSGLSQTNVQQGVTRTLGVNDAGEVIVTNNNSTNQIAPSNVSLTSLEKNVLFYAHKRFKYTQTGSAKLDDVLLFDGSFEPSYTNTAPSETDPTVVLIEDLPQYHVQRGVWIGWSTRYWPSTKFKIEVFDTWNYSGNANYNKWVTIANESNYAGYDYKVFLPTSSIYPVISKIRFTFYNGSGENGRLGVSELFYLSPEISKAYDGFLAKLNPDGNLGIGTVTPIEKLSVFHSGANTPFGAMGIDVNSFSNNANASNSYFFRVRDIGANSTPFIISGNGNVGIGTTTPTAILDINGPSRLRGLLEMPTNTDFIWNAYYSNSTWKYRTNGFAGGFYQDGLGGLAFNVAPSGQTDGALVFKRAYTVLNNGNFGIGTSSPASNLEVVGDNNSGIRLSGNTSRLTFAGSKTNLWNLDNADGTLRFFKEDYNATSFGPGGVVSMAISNNGNVGIGITTPSEKLEILGNMILSGTNTKQIYNWSGIAAFSTGIFGNTTNNTRFSIYTNSAGEAFSVNYLNGSVGIGTTMVPANYKFAVAGDMIAERVVVKLTGNWPDYVFSPSYKRSTLLEVEEYINKNQHLPNIPSAKEVAENGIDVGKMNAKLLEKMEEMTLYMIEQQKEIKALREEVEQIKDKK